VRVQVFKEFDDLAPAIARVFQTSLNSGTVPSDWKEALITPLFKKGERNVAYSL
jgi:hypothetical protein